MPALPGHFIFLPRWNRIPLHLLVVTIENNTVTRIELIRDVLATYTYPPSLDRLGKMVSNAGNSMG